MKYVSRVTPVSLKAATLTPIYELPIREFIVEISDRHKEWYESWATSVLINEYLHNYEPAEKRFIFTSRSHMQISNMIFPNSKLILAYRTNKMSQWEVTYAKNGAIIKGVISADLFREWASDRSDPLYFVGIARPRILRT